MVSLKTEKAAKRYNVCASCDQFNLVLKSCKQCGCFMPAKVLLKNAKCPLNKWDEV